MKYVLEVLFPYIILLYASDCITYLKTNHILLTSWFGKPFNIKRSGIRLAGVLPTSQAILSHDLPLHCTPDGVYTIPDKIIPEDGIVNSKSIIFIKYGDLALVESEGKSIKLNRSYTINTPSSAYARYQAEFIRELTHTGLSGRPEKIAARLKESFDLESIRKIQKSYSRAFSVIRFLSTYLFGVVFLVLPAVLYTNLSKYANLKVLVACTLLLYVLLLVATALTVKRCYKSDKDAKIYTLLSVTLSPVTALHVMGYLTRNLYFKFNYIALAACFISGAAFKELIRKELLLTDQFATRIDRQDWAELWKSKQEMLRSLLGDHGISPDEISAAPVKQDQTAISYCPYCLTEYSKERPNCIDCNIALKEFDSPTIGQYQ